MSPSSTHGGQIQVPEGLAWKDAYENIKKLPQGEQYPALLRYQKAYSEWRKSPEFLEYMKKLDQEEDDLNRFKSSDNENRRFRAWQTMNWLYRMQNDEMAKRIAQTAMKYFNIGSNIVKPFVNGLTGGVGSAVWDLADVAIDAIYKSLGIPDNFMDPMEVRKRILDGLIELAQSRKRWDKLTPEEQQNYIRQGFDPNKSLSR